MVRALICRRRVSVSSGASKICAVRISCSCRAVDQSWASSTCPIAAAACFSGNLIAPAGSSRCCLPSAIEPEEISTTWVPAARKLATSAARSPIHCERALPVAESTIRAEPIFMTTNLVLSIRCLMALMWQEGSILLRYWSPGYLHVLLRSFYLQWRYRYGAIQI